jgi:putative oxidoreductase
MRRLLSLYDAVADRLSGRLGEGMALLIVRIALAGIFWRSGRSKVVEGSWLQVSDGTHFLFENDYASVPLPPDLAATMATYAEHLFPILLAMGLATRLSATALAIMTLVIQFFVFPEAWWSVHIVWIALAAILISRGSGLFSLDAVGAKLRQQ